MRDRLTQTMLSFIFLSTSMTVFAQSYQQKLDSLLNLLPQTNEPQERVDLLNDISFAHNRISSEGILEYAEKAKVAAQKIDYKKGESLAYKHMGIAHYTLASHNDTILYYYEKSLRLAEEIDDYYTQAALHNNIGLVYYRKGRSHTAIENYLKGIEIFDKHFEEEMWLKALMITNTASSYIKINEYEKSITYFERALEMAERNGYDSIIAMLMDDYGRALTNLGRYEEAADKFDRGLKMQEKIGDNLSIAWVLNYRIDLELNLKNFETAKKLAEEALRISEEGGFEATITQSKFSMVKIAFYEKNFDKVLELGQKCIEETDEVENLVIQQETRSFMILAHQALGNYKEAFDLTGAYRQIQDESLKNEKAAYTAELEAKYLNREQTREIEYLNKEKELTESRFKLMTVSVILALIAIFYILFLLKKRNQAHRIIKAKNLKLEKYIEYNLQLENFAHIASHDLKTPLRTIVSFSQLLKKSALEKLDKKESEYFDFIINGTKEMSMLIDDLLNYSKIGKSKLNVEQIDVPVFVQNILEKNKTYIEEKSAKIALDIQASQINADSLKLSQLLQNLILNAVKFHKPDVQPEVTIKTKETENQWIFSVQDNGIGIEENFFDKIFLIFRRLNRKDEYTGTGIGLAICKKIVDMHGGRIWVESKKGTGSEFQFSLPKKLS